MLYQALKSQNNEVLLISFKRQYPNWLFPGQSDKDPSKQSLEVEDAQYWIDSLNPITWLTTFRRIYRYQPDIIVLQWWTTFWMPAWAILGLLNYFFLHKPLLYICHNVLPHESKWWDVWLTKLVLKLGTRFIVQSSRERKKLLTLIPDIQVMVVPHPIYDMFADDRLPKQEARRFLNLPLDALILLFFGIVREYKGLMDALTAFSVVKKQLNKAILVIAGEFWDDKQCYLDKIKTLGIENFVRIEDGYVPNEKVPAYFSAADVLIAPYRRVTGSGVLQMSRGMGTPIITTNVASEELSVMNEANLFSVSPNAPEVLADAILRFFQMDYANTINRVNQNKKEPSWSEMARIVTGEGWQTVEKGTGKC